MRHKYVEALVRRGREAAVIRGQRGEKSDYYSVKVGTLEAKPDAIGKPGHHSSL